MSAMSARARRLVAAVLSVGTGLAAQQGLPEGRAGGAAQVTAEQVKAWVSTLASPEFEGRGTGQEGFRKAAEFVRDQLAALGLEPGGDDGTFFQKLPWTSGSVDAARTRLCFRKGERELVIPAERLGGFASKDFAAHGAALLVANADADELGKLDDAKDKVVLLLLGGDDQATRMQALGALQQQGAAAVLFASRAPVQNPLQVRSGTRGGNRAVAGMRLAPAVVTFGGADLTALLDLAGVPAPGQDRAVRELSDVAAELAVAIRETDAPACNVVARLPGRNPQKQGEHVVIGSHLDHLGKRGATWFPGADDDGSGTTGVLAVATMFARNQPHPDRSVLFVCFCGEELGLRGSAFFVEHCPIPLASIVGELQMDMIGRNEEEAHDGGRLVNVGERAEDNRNSLHLVGTQKLSPQLHALCLQKNAAAKFDLEWDQESMFSRSDHANFGRMGVPIAFFFTGLHRDYHQPTDTPDKIEYEKLLRVARYVYDIALELAQQDGRPLVDPQLWSQYPRKGSAQPAAPMAAAAPAGTAPPGGRR